MTCMNTLCSTPLKRQVRSRPPAGAPRTVHRRGWIDVNPTAAWTPSLVRIFWRSSPVRRSARMPDYWSKFENKVVPLDVAIRYIFNNHEHREEDGVAVVPSVDLEKFLIDMSE